MTATTYCGQCGQAADEAESFCVACGNRLRRPDNAPATAAVAAREERGEDGVALRHAVGLLASRQPQTALTVLKRLVEERPDWAVAHAYLGIAYLRLTRIPEARDELEEAVRLAPESFICRTRYAEFLARLGFYDQAMAQLDIALAQPVPDDGSRYAALELRQFCKEHAKNLYYREFRYPRLSLRKLWPGRLLQSRTQPNGGGN